jgi:FAD:protein FMN transferase
LHTRVRYVRRLAAFSLTFAALASSAGPGTIRLERKLNAMGTSYTLDLYGSNAGLLEAAAEESFEEVERLDHMMSDYLPDSELSKVNDYAADRPVTVSRELFNLLEACTDYSRKSQGAFDITVGPLMKVWGFYKGTGHLPHRAEIKTALSLVGYQKVQLDPTHLTVHFAEHGMNLDLGGVGKGYAVDRVADILRRRGIVSALISGGGSSIYAIGTPPTDPRGWYIRIRDPKDADQTAADVYLKNESLSTSGNYEKFFWAEGKLYSHIMNPRTGYPSEGVLSVSIVSPKTLDSEIWAKPYYILGRTWTVAHKPKDFRVLMCEDKLGVPCAWLH